MPHGLPLSQFKQKPRTIPFSCLYKLACKLGAVNPRPKSNSPVINFRNRSNKNYLINEISQVPKPIFCASVAPLQKSILWGHALKHKIARIHYIVPRKKSLGKFIVVAFLWPRVQALGQ